MNKKKLLSLILVLALVPFALSACAKEEATPEAPAPEPTDMPMPEPTDAPAPEPSVDPSGQTVTFWHVWGAGSEADVLTALVEEFNATNEWGITVVALDQGRYGDVENAMNAAIQSGDVPTTVVGYGNVLSSWEQVGVMADFNDFVHDATFGLTDEEYAAVYEANLTGGVTAGGVRVGWPISQSANVLFYNATWAKELGFESPPANSAEFKEQACAAAEANNSDDDPDNDGTGGLVLYAGASNVASWVFAFGGGFMNDTGDGYNFNNDVVKDVAVFLKDLQDSGCTLTTEGYPNPEFATRKALFTMSSTAGLNHQYAAFEEAGSSDEWTLLPFVGPDGTKSVNAFGQYIGIVKSTPEQDLATWLFIRYLTSPEVQAQWYASSNYYPTNSSTIGLMGDFATENPLWTLGLEYSGMYGQAEPNLPSWSTVRRAVGDAFQKILQAEDADAIVTLLEELDGTAAEAVADTQ
ncbi:MAG: extracellular solute-binding protein [Anaerolineae bacterium]|nr:extracellular solute-binding protein [Anaerolineae bacterium]